MTSLLNPSFAVAALAGAIATVIGLRVLTRRIEKKNTELRSALAHMRKYSGSRDPLTESIVDSVCARNTALTREAAREEIEAHGF